MENLSVKAQLEKLDFLIRLNDYSENLKKLVVGRYWYSPIKIYNDLLENGILPLEFGFGELHFDDREPGTQNFEDQNGEFTLIIQVTVSPEDFEKAQDIFLGDPCVGLYGTGEDNIGKILFLEV